MKDVAVWVNLFREKRVCMTAALGLRERVHNNQCQALS